MSEPHHLGALLDWCASNFIEIDERLQVQSSGEGGIGVYSTDCIIPALTTLVMIHKDSVLSVRSSALSGVIPTIHYGLGAQLTLSLALYGEILKGRHSRWYGYLQSLPKQIVDLPAFWDHPYDSNNIDDGMEAHLWLRGTEAGKIVQAVTDTGTSLIDIHQYYDDTAKPLLLRHHFLWESDAAIGHLTLDGFYRAFSLVSSRSFLVDAYHGLAMVPIADAFNHVQDNHIHLESDYNVCRDCGSLHECLHDRDESDENSTSAIGPVVRNSDHDKFYEIVSNSPIAPLTEVFNTYGEGLTNAQLLNQYGFALDINDNDRLFWEIEEILEVLAPDQDIGKPIEEIAVYCREILHGFSADHALFSDSQLVYHNRLTRDDLCLNDEGKMSHQLWAILLLLAHWRQNHWVLDDASQENFHQLLDLQFHLESLDSDDEFENFRSATLGSFNPRSLQTLNLICGSAVNLCTKRRWNSGKPGSYNSDLSDILDTIAEDRPRTKLAMSVLISERSILDCCEAGWVDLMSKLPVSF
ncbi:hypothetical protein B0H34DRAFT_379734 [Crassisporium funariophilum]|nr:hypothetical protein B0H34DRAFT_379734 [Crassisporium funariophilum]